MCEANKRQYERTGLDVKCLKAQLAASIQAKILRQNAPEMACMLPDGFIYLNSSISAINNRHKSYAFSNLQTFKRLPALRRIADCIKSSKTGHSQTHAHIAETLKDLKREMFPKLCSSRKPIHGAGQFAGGLGDLLAADKDRALRTYCLDRDGSNCKADIRDLTFHADETASEMGQGRNYRKLNRDGSLSKEKRPAKKYQDLKEACFVHPKEKTTFEISKMNKKTKHIIDNWATNQLDSQLRKAMLERLSNSKSPRASKSVSSKSSTSKRAKKKATKKKPHAEKALVDPTPRSSIVSKSSKKSPAKSQKSQKSNKSKSSADQKILKNKLTVQTSKNKQLQRATAGQIPQELESIINKCRSHLN